MAQSSLLGELEVEVEIKAPAAKFYHMYAGKPHHVAKATPRNVQACDMHDGEWGEVGSIIYWNYVHDGQAKVAKERIEVVEPEKKLIKFRVLEGDIMEEFKSFLITIQVTPKQGGNGSIVKWHFEYEKIDENVSHPETLLPFFADMIKEIDEHLLSEEYQSERQKIRRAMESVKTLELEIQVNMTADRFFNTFKKKENNFTDKAEIISVHRDDPISKSSIQIWNFIVDGKMEQIKEKIDVDEENKSVSFLALEGDVLKLYRSYKIILEVVPKDDLVCIAKWTWEYEKLNDDVPSPTKYTDVIKDYTRDLEIRLLSES